MARINGPIKVWNRNDTVPTDAEGGFAGGDSTAAAVGTSLDQSGKALGTVDNLAATAQTLEYGAPATATITGTSPWKTIHIGIPKGMSDAVGQQLVTDAQAAAQQSTASAADAADAVLLAQQAQAAAYNVPDVAMRDIITNPVTETRAAVDSRAHAVSTAAIANVPAHQLAPMTAKTVTHNPSSMVSVAPFGSWGAVDPALSVTFVVPPSGKVIVTLSAQAAIGSGTGAATMSWALEYKGLIPPNTYTQSGRRTAAGEAFGPVPTQMKILFDQEWNGSPLTPGTTATITWVHRAWQDGTNSRTMATSQLGAATMVVEPVSDRVTDRPLTSTISADLAVIPLDLTRDRSTLIGQEKATKRVAWSLNDGATWNTNTNSAFPSAIQNIRCMDDGELLVFVGTSPANNLAPTIWRSSGFANDKAGATWTQVHEQDGPAPGQGSWGSWGVDSHGPVVIANEYGPKWNGNGTPAPDAEQWARYSYLSEDYGATWRTIFDAKPRTSGENAHMHGAAYDPWWDALWLTVGDGDGNNSSWLSLDRGETWRDLQQEHQFTSVYALPDCIVFVTDEGAPNGMFRIPRTHPNVIVWELAHMQDNDTLLSIIGTRAFQARTRPGSPLLLPCGVGSKTGPGRLFATYDGHEFMEIWNDAGQTYQNFGLKNALGPTLSGAYVCLLERPGGTSHMVTLTVN